MLTLPVLAAGATAELCWLSSEFVDCLLRLLADDPVDFFDGADELDEESELAGAAAATYGVAVLTARPTPRATASAPTLPTWCA